MSPSPETYSTLLRSAVRRLIAAGVEQPAQNARRLLCSVMGVTPAALISAETAHAHDDHARRFEQLVRRRVRREPLAHILGQTCFYDLELTCDDRALVPRSDSECVVDLALSLLPEDSELTILDLGTGSGCLLLALLAQRPKARGFGVDISGHAIALAAENADRTGLSDRVRFQELNWAKMEDWQEARLVISNPPYIRHDTIPTLAPEVRAYDPLSALDGGSDGLDAYREILSYARHKMIPGALLVFEIGYDQDAAVSDLLTGAGYDIIEHRKDLAGHNRAIAARLA